MDGIRAETNRIAPANFLALLKLPKERDAFLEEGLTLKATCMEAASELPEEEEAEDANLQSTLDWLVAHGQTSASTIVGNATTLANKNQSDEG